MSGRNYPEPISSHPNRRAPHIRSVALSNAPQRLIHFEPPLKRESPGSQPLSEFGRAPSDQSVEISVKEAAYSSGTKIGASASSWRVPSPDERWRVDQSVLPPRPNDYPLERTSRVVQGATADVVASRLSKCLQSRSIETKFSEAEVNVAKCRNTNFVKFYIRLYSTRGDGGNGVLVEIQRLCGDCVSFIVDCRALLDASEGNMGREPAFPEGEKSLYLRMPISEMSFFKSAALPPVDEAEPVNMTADLLASNHSDANLLGMESLATLTDITKTSKATAVLSAKRVLCPEHQDNKSFNMHNFVMSLIIFGNDTEDNSFYEGTAFEDHAMKLRNLAVCSVANSLAIMSSEGHLFDVLDSCRDWYTDVLVPKLVQDLSTAKDHPHDACYASRCLSSLAMTCDGLVDKIKIVGGLYALQNAQKVGQNEFALLETDARKCHELIMRRSVC
ncbi:hypothetical protein HJC23_012326 [Cyclotella cryptica]|uniref:Uncharacterized protein n=1 Tax=Cyclotella cryptica TaxID=29204 RepID=A0ABD3QCA7_9STRA